MTSTFIQFQIKNLVSASALFKFMITDIECALALYDSRIIKYDEVKKNIYIFSGICIHISGLRTDYLAILPVSRFGAFSENFAMLAERT